MLKKRKMKSLYKTPHINEIFTEDFTKYDRMTSLCKWFSLGQELGIEHKDLRIIDQQDLHDPDDKRLFVLHKFLSDFDGNDLAKSVIISRATRKLMCNNSYAFTNIQKWKKKIGKIISILFLIQQNYIHYTKDSCRLELLQRCKPMALS